MSFLICDDLTEEMVANNTEISWYGHANVVSRDYISAKSMNCHLAMYQLI